MSKEAIPVVREFANPVDYLWAVRPIPSDQELMVVRGAFRVHAIWDLVKGGLRDGSRDIGSPRLALDEDCFVAPEFMPQLAERLAGELGIGYQVAVPRARKIVNRLGQDNPRKMVSREQNVGLIAPYIGQLWVYNTESNRARSKETGRMARIEPGDLLVSRRALYVKGKNGEHNKPYHWVVSELLTKPRVTSPVATRPQHRRPG